MNGFSRRQGRVVACAAIAAAMLAGCSAMEPLADEARSGAHDLIEASHLRPLGVNPDSPIAADAEKAEQVSGPVPNFASVPPAPGDVRGAPAYKDQVVSLVSDKRLLNQWSNVNPPKVDDPKTTDAFAEAERKRVGNETPVAPEKAAETAAFVKQGQKAVGQPETPPKSPQN